MPQKRITPEQLDAVVENVRTTGLPLDKCCALAGMHVTTFYDHINKDEDLELRWQQADAEIMAVMLAEARVGGKGSSATMTYILRRWGRLFPTYSKSEVNSTHEVNINNVQAIERAQFIGTQIRQDGLSVAGAIDRLPSTTKRSLKA